uniref:Uncharacterized protein n=1 Tax=Rhizophora mucronata TaxID=61149 RepID=A0A2P2R2B3_RHIMU
MASGESLSKRTTKTADATASPIILMKFAKRTCKDVFFFSPVSSE